MQLNNHPVHTNVAFHPHIPTLSIPTLHNHHHYSHHHRHHYAWLARALIIPGPPVRSDPPPSSLPSKAAVVAVARQSHRMSRAFPGVRVSEFVCDVYCDIALV